MELSKKERKQLIIEMLEKIYNERYLRQISIIVQRKFINRNKKENRNG